MTDIIPNELKVAVQEGRAVLFLGSGASRGATGFIDGKVPDGQGLANILAKKFLTDQYLGFDLKRVYDLSCSRRDVRTVQKFLFDLFDPIIPADFHLLIPTFTWAGLVGTNYDQLIEKSYALQSDATQRLEVNTKDGDGATDRVGSGGVLYVKLHGCISRHSEIHPPMIAGTEQFIRYTEGRIGQFDTFLEWAKSKTLIFCGYSFDDSNLRSLLHEIIAEGDNRPRHYIVNKGVLMLEAEYWRERRIIAIDSTFENLLNFLNGSLSEETRKLGVLNEPDGTTFRRFITVPAERESPALRQYLGSLIEHVASEFEPLPADAAKFYSGFDLGWAPIGANLDVRQPIVDQVLRDHIAAPIRQSAQPIVVIKGHAGSGKTVALRRISYEAAKDQGKLCFFLNRRHIIDLDRFDEIFSLSNFPVYVFIDNIAFNKTKVIELIARARRAKASIVICGTETFNTWNGSCDDLEPFIGSSLEMRYLSETNISLLIEKLSANDCLGDLKSLTPEKRIHALEHKYGRQLLVALLEATHGVPLQDIIIEEYQSIESPKSRLLYLDICSLHRFGPPVRAGLISRIHDINFEEFSKNFFKPLEQIVVLREDKRSGDYVYEARHSHIADAIYHGILKTEDDRFDNIVRIVGKLNPNFSYDLEVLGKIIRAGNLEAQINNPAKIRQIYDVAISSVGETVIILHQKGIFELHQAGNVGQLDVAESLLEKALSLDTFNRSIKHSLAEVDLKRSRLATEPAVKSAWRRSAVERAAALIAKGTSAYPHHTLLKAAIDGVEEAMVELEKDPSEAATLSLGDHIAHAESVLNKGLQAFPNEAILLGEEGNLSKILSQASRAERAFNKAFEANPRSSLIAKRLSRIKRSKGNYSEAASILRQCLEYNPGHTDLHYDYAMTLMEDIPNAPVISGETLLFHLKRSFTPGDRSRQAQFWYARQLCISGYWPEAKELFDRLSNAQLPFREKTQVRGFILNEDGSRQTFSGPVVHVAGEYGFVRCEQFDIEVFFVISDIPVEDVPFLDRGVPIRFTLGFSLKGPVASDIEL